MALETTRLHQRGPFNLLVHKTEYSSFPGSTEYTSQGHNITAQFKPNLGLVYTSVRCLNMYVSVWVTSCVDKHFLVIIISVVTRGKLRLFGTHGLHTSCFYNFPWLWDLLFLVPLKSLGGIQPPLPSLPSGLYKHTTNRCQTAKPFTPGSRECTYKWGALPKETAPHCINSDLYPRALGPNSRAHSHGSTTLCRYFKRRI